MNKKTKTEFRQISVLRQIALNVKFLNTETACLGSSVRKEQRFLKNLREEGLKCTSSTSTFRCRDMM